MTSRRIASFLMLSTLKNEEVSQDCFVFGRCQVQTLRKSRRIAAFLVLSSSKSEGVSQNLMMSSSKPEDVSQNSFVFKLADRHVDR